MPICEICFIDDKLVIWYSYLIINSVPNALEMFVHYVVNIQIAIFVS